jgi:bifunctional ADP-heptose synthase (sugar kinase/adenylyltransferase)
VLQPRQQGARIKLDTREKIVDAAQAARIAASGATVVSGYFDPLVASHAERLAALKTGAKLLVLIATPDNPILPAAARAELVAGLRAVDYVAELTDGLTPQIHLEQEDAERFTLLLQHVHARNKCES